MRVGVVAQAEVAFVVRAVDRLLQGAQQHRLQQVEIGPTLDLREQFGVIEGRGIVSAVER